jgi:RND superfamily putative drug exporter
MRRLARTSYRRRRLVLVGWIVLLVAVFALSQGAGGVFKNDFFLNGAESTEAFDVLEERGFPDRAGFSGQVVFEAEQGVDDPAVQRPMEGLFAEIEENVDDVEVVSPYGPAGTEQIAEGGTIAYAEINLADRPDADFNDAADEIEELGSDIDVEGLTVAYGGDLFYEDEPAGSEAIALLFAIVILLIAFGSVLAAGLPILTALFGIGTGIAFVQLAANGLAMPDFTNQGVAMIGIGVGIDYALLIVTRYRQALHDGRDPENAVVTALDTAGRSVVFAGTTVVIAVLGMLIINVPAVRGLAVGIALGVSMTMLAAVTLLPAVLGFVGRNIDKLGLPHRRRAEGEVAGTFWQRWSHVIQRRPWPPLLVGLVALLVLTVPVVSMRLAFADAGNRPTSDTTRVAYDLISDGFGPGFNGPLLLAVELPGGEGDAAVLDELTAQLNQTDGIVFATPPQMNEAGDAAIMQVFPTTSPQSEETANLVDELRDNVLPPVTAGTGVDVLVGGITAGAVDYSAYTGNMLPVFIAAVLVLSFLLLMLVFRSLLVPLKAVIMNLLSIGAAYGAMVAVFQWGWLKDLFGIEPGPVEAWAPMMLFAIVFGLSMDYEVFLLSRMREEYDRTGDNATAVADGLAVTARVITAAAAIMVFVFGAFILGSDRAVKLFGFGMAFAILVDATLIRLVLVPATMELLGDRNWWLPQWLDRILPVVHVEPPKDLDEELRELTEEREAEPAS